MKNKVDVDIFLGIQGDDIAIFHALGKLGQKYHDMWLEAHTCLDDDDGEAMGTFQMSGLDEIIKIICALKEVHPQYNIYLKTPNKDEGFEITVWPERIWAEVYRDSDKILASSKEKIATAIKLLGEI